MFSTQAIRSLNMTANFLRKISLKCLFTVLKFMGRDFYGNFLLFFFLIVSKTEIKMLALCTFVYCL